MVRFEINAAGLAVFELEGDAPRSIDMDRIPFRIEPLQGMKVEARNVHFLGSYGDVETVKSRENAFMHLRIDLRTPALRPQLESALLLKVRITK
jgi:hypothetical protein